MPYILYLYSKLCLGISYQVSVFELKYIIEHYFKGTHQTTYARKRKIMYYIMWVWRLGIAIFFVCDIYFNYWRYIFNTSIPESQTGFAKTSYLVTAINFGLLAILLLSQTCSIVCLVKTIGDRLQDEVRLLKIIMWFFSISYAIVTIFYFW